MTTPLTLGHKLDGTTHQWTPTLPHYGLNGDLVLGNSALFVSNIDKESFLAYFNQLVSDLSDVTIVALDQMDSSLTTIRKTLKLLHGPFILGVYVDRTYMGHFARLWRECNETAPLEGICVLGSSNGHLTTEEIDDWVLELRCEKTRNGIPLEYLLSYKNDKIDWYGSLITYREPFPPSQKLPYFKLM